MSYPNQARRRRGGGLLGRSRMGCTTRLVIALIFVAFGAIKFYATTNVELNPYTNKSQRVTLTPAQEKALGVHTAPKLIQQHGGQSPDPRAQALVDTIGQKLVNHVQSTAFYGEPINYEFDFHLLADDQLINAFALPGGQIFITEALFNKLNEAQLAGVLGHEIGHVVARHSNEQMSKSTLLKSIGSGVGMLLGGENMGASQQVGQMVSQVMATRYGREDEFESDRIGVLLMYRAGYNPREMLGVLQVLKDAAKGARQIEMLSTHPDPDKRMERIKLLLDQLAAGQKLSY